MEPIGPAKLNNFTVDFIPNRSLAAEAIENHPLVQIEITTEITWVLSEKEID